MSLVLALAMSVGLVPQVMAETTETDKTVVLVNEDWNYDQSKMPSNGNGGKNTALVSYDGELNGGLGFHGEWKGNPECTSAITSGSGHGYVYFNLNAVGDNPTGGFNSNGADIYRKLLNPIKYDVANEFYVTWADFVQKTPKENDFCGIYLGQDVIKLGATRYNGTEEINKTKTVLGVATPDGTVKANNGKIIANGNSSHTYVAKITINPEGKDSISINAYKAGNGKSEYPTEWDLTVECDITKDIDTLGYLATGEENSNAYFTPVSIYKKQSDMSKGDIEEYIKANLAKIPSPDEILAKDISECEKYVNNINEALTWNADINLTALDTENKIAGYENKIIDAKAISKPVDISADMKANVFVNKEKGVGENPRLRVSDNQGWDVNDIKKTLTWKNTWGENDKFNTAIIDGIEYTMKLDSISGISDSYNCNGQAVRLALDGKDTGDARLYYEYDLENDYYNSINLLAAGSNSYYTTNATTQRNQMSVMLMYADGSSEVKQKKLYDVTDNSAAVNAMTKIGFKLYNGAPGFQESGVVGNAHIYEYEVDNSKKLDKIRVLKSYTMINEDKTGISDNNGVPGHETEGFTPDYYLDSQEAYTYTGDDGNEVNTTLGQYMQTKLSRTSKSYTHSVYGTFLALTAVTNAENIKKTVLEKVNAWPESFTTKEAVKYKAEFETIEKEIAEIEATGASVSEIKANAKYTAMKEASKLLRVVSEKVDISSKFTMMGYAYQDGDKYPGQNPYMRQSPNTGMDIEEVKKLPNWRYNWNNITDDFNVYTLGDMEYSLKVIYGYNINSKKYNVGMGNGGVNNIEIDVNDGNYSSLSVLASGDNNYYSNNTNPYLCLNLYYEGETAPVFVYQKIDSATEPGNDDSLKITAAEVGSITGGWGVTGGKLYMHRYDFPVDYSKTLTKVEVISSYNKLNDTKTGVVATDNTDYTKQYCRANIYAMTLAQYAGDYLNEYEASIKQILADEIAKLTDDSTDEQIWAVKKQIDEAQINGAEVEKIEGYDKYTSLLNKLERVVTTAVTTVDGDEIDSIYYAVDEKMDIAVTVSSIADVDYTSIVALYDGNDKLQIIFDIHSGKIQNGSDTYSFKTGKISDEADESWYYKIITVENTSTMRPLGEAFKFGGTN